MRIGIDARFLTHPQAGGFKTYTVNLLAALSQIDPDNEYFIYIDRPPSDETVLLRQANFTYRIVPGTIPLVGMPLREQVRLRLQIWRDKVDLGHFLCNTAPVRLSSPYVVTLHDTIQVTAKRAWTGNLASIKLLAMTEYSRQDILHSVRKADRVITVSDYERGEICKTLQIPPDRVVVTHLAPNPIYRPLSDKEKEAGKDQLNRRFGVNRSYVLGIGYEPRKNIPLLIQAFAALSCDLEHLNLVVVVANENQRRLYQEQVASIGLSSRIRLIGALSPEDLVLFYNLAEVFVFPSTRESFGLPPVEAMACGTPTITMNLSSIPEVVQDGANLVDSTDADIWANILRQVIGSEKQRAELRERGLRRATMLSWLKCAEETLNVYRGIAQRVEESVGIGASVPVKTQ
jgi:glycosyltransferase involved in cell wall biosynthesis